MIDSEFPSQKRITQRQVASAGLRASNNAIILGDIKNGYIKIDYINKRIIINDGSNDRIIIGYQEDGF